MRIDTSNLLVAAQVQPQRPGVAGNPQAPRFEPLDFAKPSGAQPVRQTAPPGAGVRPGSQLDIKV
jgi:hypothetical protein